MDMRLERWGPGEGMQKKASSHKCRTQTQRPTLQDSMTVTNSANTPTDDERFESTTHKLLPGMEKSKYVPQIFQGNKCFTLHPLAFKGERNLQRNKHASYSQPSTENINDRQFSHKRTSQPSDFAHSSRRHHICAHVQNNNVAFEDVAANHNFVENLNQTSALEHMISSHCTHVSNNPLSYHDNTAWDHVNQCSREDSITQTDYHSPSRVIKVAYPMQVDEVRNDCMLYEPNEINIFDQVPTNNGDVAIARSLSKSARMCRRFLMLLVCLLVILGFALRIVLWYQQYKAMKNYFVYTNHELATPREDMPNNPSFTNWSAGMPHISEVVDRTQRQVEYKRQSTDGPVVTICNVNPLRGTSLFGFQNGSVIYDRLLHRMQAMFGDTIDNNHKFTNQRTLLSVDLVVRAGNRIEDMLKRCQSGRTRYYAANFSRIITLHGLCHLLRLNQEDHQIEFVMDPQEYDYLLPNSGLVGFRVWFHVNENQARAELEVSTQETHVPLSAFGSPSLGIQSNELIVSTEFTTIARIGIGLNGWRQNYLSSGAVCSSSSLCTPGKADNFQVTKTKMNSRDHPSLPRLGINRNVLPNPMIASILSITQTPKSSMLYSLLALQIPRLYRRNAQLVSWGLRIQQRALLQLINQTAFEELLKLKHGFAELQNELRKTTTQLYLMRKQLWNDERTLLQRGQNNDQCLVSSLHHVRSLLNTSSSFYEDLCSLSPKEQMYIGNIRTCNTSFENDFQRNATIDQSIKIMLPKELLHGFRLKEQFKSAMGKKHHEDNVDYYLETSKANLLELQLIHIFFTTPLSSSKLKDVLRQYLRPLSAKRMQLRPRLDNVKSRANVNEQQQQQFQTSFRTESCDSHSGINLKEKFHSWLGEIGKQIAACLQRLEQFVDGMNLIVAANTHIIEAFQLSHQNLSKLDSTQLVSFTLQLETDAHFLLTHQITPLDTVLNPFGELLTICFTSLGVLLSLLLLIAYGFHRVPCQYLCGQM